MNKCGKRKAGKIVGPEALGCGEGGDVGSLQGQRAHVWLPQGHGAAGGGPGLVIPT